MKKTIAFIFLFIAMLAFNFSLASAEEKADPEEISWEAKKIFNKVREREAIRAEAHSIKRERKYIGNFSGTAYRAREMFSGNSVVSELIQKEKTEPAREKLMDKILGGLKNILSI